MHLTFEEYLEESFKNLFDVDDKQKYADEVWELLQTSYKRIGGIKGKGFASKEDMVKNIPMWKLSFVSGELVAVVMYKDTNGRKLVALGATSKGKAKVEEILNVEFSRSYSEISGPLLAFIEKRLPGVIRKYAIPTSKVSEVLNKSITIIDDFHYSRKLGGVEIRKMMIGTTNKNIK